MSRATISPSEALAQLIAECKQLDASEVGERWNQFNGAIAVAEMVLRDYVEPEPVGYIAPYLLDSLAIYRETAKIPSNWSVAVRAGKRNQDDVSLYAAPLHESGSAAAVPHGCFIDLEEGQKPDACVLDGGIVDHCFYARKHGDQARKHCGEWKPIKIAAAAPAIAAPTEMERDAKRWRYSMDFQRKAGAPIPKAMTEMWRKVIDDNRTFPTVEEYEAATDAAIDAAIATGEKHE